MAADIKNQITINDIAILIHSNTSVCISVESKTDIQLFFFDKILKNMDMSGTTVCIDIESIRMIIDHIGLSTQCIKNTLGNHPRTAV